MTITEHPEHQVALDQLIAARVLSPGARNMSLSDIAFQHNEANALGPTDPEYINPGLPLINQIHRILAASR